MIFWNNNNSAKIMLYLTFSHFSRLQLGCAVFAYIFFSFQSKKIPYFSLSFALTEYKRRTLGAPVSIIYFFRFKAKKIPNFSLIFPLSGYERRTLVAAYN
jgi:hypothetical protein